MKHSPINPIPKPRGRPRTTPIELSPSDLAALWQRQLRRAGGKPFRVYLGASAVAALEKMTGSRERGPLIEKLILAEYQRRRSAGKSS